MLLKFSLFIGLVFKTLEYPGRAAHKGKMWPGITLFFCPMTGGYNRKKTREAACASRMLCLPCARNALCMQVVLYDGVIPRVYTMPYHRHSHPGSPATAQ